MVSYLALYRGKSVATADLVAVSTDPKLIAYASKHLLRDRRTVETEDPAIGALAAGRRRALKLVHEEAVAP